MGSSTTTEYLTEKSLNSTSSIPLLSTTASSSTEPSSTSPTNIRSSPTQPLTTSLFMTESENLIVGCMFGGIAFMILLTLAIIMKHKQQYNRRTHAELSEYNNHNFDE